MIALLMAVAGPEKVLGVSMTGAGVLLHDKWLRMDDQQAPPPATGAHNPMPAPQERAEMMLGPSGSYAPVVAEFDPERDAPSSVIDEYGAMAWDGRLRLEGPRIAVPVQLVIPEFDYYYRADAEALNEARALLEPAPVAEVRVQRGVGHSAELHHLYRAHVCRVAAFADECGARATLTAGHA
jgi:hypothetical protein